MIRLIIVSIFVFAILVIFSVYYLSLVIGLIRTKGVPFVSLSKKQLKAIDKHIKLNSTDRMVDLGCGDGRVLRMFEKQGAKDLTGYEVNFWAYLLAKIKNKILNSQSKIYFKNFKKVDLSKYNIVFCYLMDYYINSPSFKEKLNRELKPGTKIISYAFEIKNWYKPEIIYINEKNKKLGKVFIYRK